MNDLELVQGIVILVIGIIIGAVASYLLGSKSKQQVEKVQKELDALSDENEKLRKRSKEAERHIEDLNAEIEKLHRQLRSHNDDNEDLKDDLADAKNKVKKQEAEIAGLKRQIQELTMACQAYEVKINNLKKN